MTRRAHIDSLLASVLLIGFVVGALTVTDQPQPLPATIEGTMVLLPGAYQITETVTIQPGGRLVGYGCMIESTVPADAWSIVVGSTQSRRSSIEGIQLRVKTEGANGIRLHEAQYARLEGVGIVGGTKAKRLADVGLSIDGGTKGAAFNVVDGCAVLACKTGVLLTTDASVPAFSNANDARGLSVWACDTGIHLEAASTNRIEAATQICGAGWRVDKRSRYNRLEVRDEKPASFSIVAEPGAKGNAFSGTWAKDKVSAVTADSFWEPLN